MIFNRLSYFKVDKTSLKNSLSRNFHSDYSSLLAQRGFSLLELIIVLFLLGLLMSVVVSTLPNQTKSELKKAEKTIYQSFEKFQFDSKQQGQMIGIVLSKTSWQFKRYFFDSEHAEKNNLSTQQLISWNSIEGHRLNTKGELPDGAFFRLYVGEKVYDRLPSEVDLPLTVNEATEPQIYLLPGGEMTPFILEFYDPKSQLVAEIVLDELGQPIVMQNETD